MPGERDLKTLLQNMTPEMHEGVFVFCSISEDKEIPATLKPLHIFREREGTTFIVRREEAESAGLSYQFASRLITLTVHSSLEAVGFLAAVAGRLAEAGISVNAVSAFYHDHLFVPEHRADEALHHLQNMSRKRSPPIAAKAAYAFAIRPTESRSPGESTK
ncbi:ACT domain-containing protein [Bradyrhizobium sp. CSA112]|nr:ACT domain-containing protein [Bradyrhizobium sp. CSA112]